MSLEDQIPGYARALAQEEKDRDYAFLDLPHQVCGVSLKALTLRQTIALINIGSPWLCGGRKGAADVAKFLWFLSPGYAPADKTARAQFLQKIARKRLDTCIKKIDAFMKLIWMDAPPKVGSPKRAFSSSAAALVDRLAREYGWSKAAIMEEPMPCLFQYLRHITLRETPDTVFFSQADKAKGAYLAKLKKRKGRKK